MRSFLLNTQYDNKSSEDEDKTRRLHIQTFLEQDLNQQLNETFCFVFDESQNMDKVKCIPCNKILQSSSEYTLTQHFESRGHGQKIRQKSKEEERSIPPRKSKSPNIPLVEEYIHCYPCDMDLRSHPRAVYERHCASKRHLTNIKKRSREEGEGEEKPKDFLKKRLMEERDKRLKDTNYINELFETGIFNDIINQMVRDKIKEELKF